MRRMFSIAGSMAILALGSVFLAAPVLAEVIENADGTLTFQEPLSVEEGKLKKLIEELKALEASLTPVSSDSVSSTSSSKSSAAHVSSAARPVKAASSSRAPAPVARSSSSVARPTPSPVSTPVTLLPLTGDIYRVTKPVLNLRKDARASSQQLGVLAQGQEVSVLWFAQGNQWARVRLASGTEGYASTVGLVSVSGSPVPVASAPIVQPSPPAASAPLTGDIYRVTKPVLNLRKDARASSQQLGVLAQGQEVSVLWFVQGGQWARVRLASGKEGYIIATGLESVR